MANEAQIVCALERYRLAHGEYPGTLDALSPQFIEKIPHDIIGGSRSFIAPRPMENSCSIPSAGMKRMMADSKNRRRQRTARLISPKAIGSGKIELGGIGVSPSQIRQFSLSR